MTSRTKAQARAIETIDENLAVNAGAGTGKTKVLTERYIEILDRGDLEENREVESIVAITFTKKASQEMKDRIRGEIRDNFDKDPRWKRFYRDMEKANISTIHSFCGNILRENPLEANVDPLFSIVDDMEAKEILTGLVMEVLNRNNERGGDLYRLLRLLGQDELEVLAREILELYEKIRSSGDEISSLRDRTIEGINNIDRGNHLDRLIKDDLIYLMENTGSRSKFNKLADMEVWSYFLEGNYSAEERLSIVGEIREYIGASKKNQDYIDRLEDNIGSVLLEKEKDYLWCYEIIFKILKELDEEYSLKKMERSLLDYNDLEIKTYHLFLDREDIRLKYQEKYRYIMVDEFQDTNELQKNIFYLLSSSKEPLDRNNLFVVGDPKQSIYGFRGADIDVFKGVIEDIENISGKEAIDMDKNFRSIDIIIDFVNRIFSEEIKDYKPLDFLKTSDKIKNIEIIDREDLEIPEGVAESDFHRMYEASVIGDRIEELVEDSYYSYGDIAILFRSRTHVKVYEEALKTRNIPYYNEDGDNLYERQEILDILNFLKSISTSYDKIACVGFLKSPMVGLNDETIYRLLDGLEDRSILSKMKDLELEDREEQEKLTFAYRILKKYSYEKSIYSIEGIIKSCLTITNYMDTLSLYEDREQKITNVYKFLELVREYELKNKSSLEDFIDHIEKIRAMGLIEPQAKIRLENSNLVRIMTIHKSKGLQFPVVILPEMSKLDRKESGNIVYNKNLGLGFKYEKNASLYKKIAEENRLREEEEARRIFYVAMTRGEELLIIGKQGKNRGFKKVLETIDLGDNIKLINKDYSPKKVSYRFKGIDRELVNTLDDSLEIPNLVEFESYNKKSLYSTNISQFMEFRRCRRKYYYDYYKPMPEMELARYEAGFEKNILKAVDRGNIVHSFCKQYRGEKDYREKLKKIVESYGYEYSKDIKDELKIYIDNYINFYTIDYDKIYSEKEFYLKIEDTYISGIIDRIYVKDNLAYIYDFKTNILEDKDELIDFYKPQLQLYSYAVEKLLGIRVEKASILFLEDASEIDIEIDEKSIFKNIDEIVDFVHFVEENNDIEEYKKSSNCNYCSYRLLCHR